MCSFRNNVYKECLRIISLVVSSIAIAILLVYLYIPTDTLATEGGTDHTATNPTFRSTPAAEPDDPHTNLEVPCPTKETDLSLIMSSILAAVLGATCLLLALVIALIITCRRGASRKGSMKLREEIYDDYECRRGKIKLTEQVINNSSHQITANLYFTPRPISA